MFKYPFETFLSLWWEEIIYVFQSFICCANTIGWITHLVHGWEWLFNSLLKSHKFTFSFHSLHWSFCNCLKAKNYQLQLNIPQIFNCIIKKAREFQKNIYVCFIDYAEVLPVWITINCGKFLKRWEYQTAWPTSWEICMQARK